MQLTGFLGKCHRYHSAVTISLCCYHSAVTISWQSIPRTRSRQSAAPPSLAQLITLSPQSQILASTLFLILTLTLQHSRIKALARFKFMVAHQYHEVFAEIFLYSILKIFCDYIISWMTKEILLYFLLPSYFFVVLCCTTSKKTLRVPMSMSIIFITRLEARSLVTV